MAINFIINAARLLRIRVLTAINLQKILSNWICKEILGEFYF